MVKEEMVKLLSMLMNVIKTFMTVMLMPTASIQSVTSSVLVKLDGLLQMIMAEHVQMTTNAPPVSMHVPLMLLVPTLLDLTSVNVMSGSVDPVWNAKTLTSAVMTQTSAMRMLHALTLFVLTTARVILVTTKKATIFPSATLVLMTMNAMTEVVLVINVPKSVLAKILMVLTHALVTLDTEILDRLMSMNALISMNVAKKATSVMLTILHVTTPLEVMNVNAILHTKLPRMKVEHVQTTTNAATLLITNVTRPEEHV